MIALSDVVQAKRRVSQIVNKTTFAYAPALSDEVGAQVFLKKENL
ncbi:MAG TPA: threonine ammonia-lyase, partial [Sulfurospirillum sp. UBA12182]